jgi:hypothetical protein
MFFLPFLGIQGIFYMGFIIDVFKIRSHVLCVF